MAVTAGAAPVTTVLVVGGARSGKSRYAERLLSRATGVRYVAPGPIPTDADGEWSERIRAHRTRRPPGWATVESADVVTAIRTAHAAAVLVDCLGTWLTRLVDEAGAWSDPRRARAVLALARADLVTVVTAADAHVVLVSNEVGAGVVPASASGRLFRDELGILNAAVADVCDRVVLCVAGRAVDLTAQDVVGQAAPLC